MNSTRSPRPLPRSLEPLAGESLGGYLLRLSCRLRISPAEVARLTGCAGNSAAATLSRRLLLTLDVPRFAQATRLPADTVRSLTLAPWADRYPPAARSRTGPGPPVILDDWLLATRPRYCPECLAGDRTPIQRQYGGPWQLAWQLPVAFACPRHRSFLREGCPRPHHASPAGAQLVDRPGARPLHPAQCRLPQQADTSGRTIVPCGTRLDQACEDDPPPPGDGTLNAQQALLSWLNPEHPDEDAARAFTDLRVITALLCMSWPLGADLMDPGLTAAVSDHVRGLGALSRRALDKQPGGATAAAGLLTAATVILDSPDLAGTVARHLKASERGRLSKSSWARILDRHRSTCSPALTEAAEPATRAYRRTAGPHSPRAPTRISAYRPEHIPALLEHHWYDQHLAHLGYRVQASMRRAGAVMLVQWASGGSLGDAAAYLGIRPERAQYSFAPDMARWLRGHGTTDFNAAMVLLAAQLDDTPGLVNYRNRRNAMRGWCLSLEAWQDVTSRLPPSRDRSSRSSTTASGRKLPPSPGPTSPRESRASHPARSRKPSPGSSVLTGQSYAAAPGTSSPAPAGSPTTPNCASSSSSSATASQMTSTTVGSRHRRHAFWDPGGWLAWGQATTVIAPAQEAAADSASGPPFAR